MTEINLSGRDLAVYEAVAELEDEANAPHLHDIARHAELDLDETRESVRRLTNEHRLLHEVQDTARTDVGPAYELAPRT